MAIRYKHNGRYAYETHNVWNKELKKYQTKWKYLGIVDPETGIATPKYALVPQGEKLILDYGNTFALSEYCRLSGFAGLISEVFGPLANVVLALVFYRLLESGGMDMVQEWYNGNVVRILLPGLDLCSQRISELLCKIGDETLWREFFVRYTQTVYSNNGVIIDSTGLPNDIDIQLTVLGHHGGDIAKELRMIMVVDRTTGEPLYFRYVAGNIVDVSTLKTTMNELVAYNINANHALLDAGYCSQENISALFNAQISFLMRITDGWLVFKNAVDEALPTLETIENCVLYGERILYVKYVITVLCEGHEGYICVCLDVKKKADDITRIMSNAISEKEGTEKTMAKLKNAGIFALVSPDEIAPSELLQLYYLR